MRKIVAICVVFILLTAFSTGKILRNTRIYDFDRKIEKIMEIAHFSSLSACIIKNNEIIWSKGYGIYDRENNKKTDENVIYLVASISKTITATAIMQLYEKGLLNLDDDVNKYLPFNLRNPNHPDKLITIRMLLAHQSSLASDPPAFYCYFPATLNLSGYPYPWLKEYLVPGEVNYKPQAWAEYAPGEEMSYANVGYSLLGYIVERVSGQNFEEYSRENIFEPLGMKNSSFILANLNISNVAVPYVFERGEYYPLLHYSIIDYPAGGLRTNLIDLSKFLLAHMNGGEYKGVRILSKESVEEMQRVQYESKKYSFQYGLGWQIWKRGDETYIGHTGGLYGVATDMKFRASDNVGIIFFTNKEVYNLREIVAFSLIEKLLFMKADGDKKIKISEVKEIVKENIHLLNLNWNEKEIVNAVKNFCRDLNI
ncbi:MAG: beta-lactamase family protein [Thermoplasmatales archaeon]|nr:beta-lactamase family protein [Thermoplasmatales archaeon]